MTRRSRGLLTAVLLTGLLPSSSSAATLPRGFQETVVASGFNGATAMEVAPDGRVFVCEQTGAVRVIRNDVLLPSPLVAVEVDSSWERGLLGIAMDPAFPRRPYIYLMYTPARPYPHHRISRFTARGDTAEAGSEVILFEGDNQNNLGGSVPNGHQGGAIHFGRDGKLYAAIGDQTAGEPAQSLKTLQGKLLRLNPDGSIPEDNPFFHKTTGKYRSIWALGLRNPFTFAVQSGTGRLFINDVGGANEEINEGISGANYGWPTADHGPTADARFRGPIHWYKESSIAGGVFYNPSRPQFPAFYAGRYFFGDFKAGWIHTLDPDNPKDVRGFLDGLGNLSVVDLKLAPDGSLYYLRRLAWVRDKDFQSRTGVLYRITYTGRDRPTAILSEPADQVVPSGAAAFFRVGAAGGASLRYQWQRDGKDIPDATAATLVLPAAGAADDGARFRCVVASDTGTAISTAARLKVVPTPDEDLARRLGELVVHPAPGRYTGPVTIRLSYPAGRATLRYTTNGERPTEASREYAGEFTLHKSTTVTVAVFRDGKEQGEPRVLHFTIEGETPYGLASRGPDPTALPPVPENLPATLSQTGFFTSLNNLTARPGLIPYDVNAPLWSDGAAKRRWLAPGRGGIGFSPTGEWSFPAGTVFIKHFELATDERRPDLRRRLETRLLVVDGTGYGYGVTYRWRPDGADADLLADGQREELTIQTGHGPRRQTWEYPSRADCLLCHTAAAGFVLGVKTRQLNRPFTYPGGVTDNQLRTWNYLGLFQKALDERDIPALPRLVSPPDARAPLAERARAYLDANCAHCHRPGHVIRATFDARYDSPQGVEGLIDAPTVSDSLGVMDPCVIASGEPNRSMALQRMRRQDSFRMPPLAVHVSDETGLDVLEQWVRSLAPRKKAKKP
jgi:uncharacterized repeat protein (TIGR03806 family)